MPKLELSQIIRYIDGKLELLETAPVYDDFDWYRITGREEAYEDVLNYIREHASDPG
jgi:hypothetical protein